MTASRGRVERGPNVPVPVLPPKEHQEELAIGDLVFVVGEGIGTIAGIDERTKQGTIPCSCCGLGISVVFSNPNVRFGCSPAVLTKLDRPPVQVLR